MSDTLTTLRGQSATRDASALVADGMLFRIHGSTHHGRVVRISRRTCTVGSDPSCSLRLVGQGIEPMHCLILRGSQHIAVRRWAADTQLNGVSFDDEWLTPGDRLSLGRVELEFVSETTTGMPRDLPSAAEPDAARVHAADATGQSIRRLYRGRVDRLCRALRAANSEILRLHTDVDRHHSQVGRLLSEVKNVEQRLSVESGDPTDGQVELSLPTLQDQCTRLREQVGFQRDTWRRHCGQIAELIGLDGLDDDQDLASQMSEVRDRLGQRLSEIDLARGRERRRLEDQLAHQREQLDQQLEQLAREQEIVLERQEELERAREEVRERWNELEKAEQDAAQIDRANLDDELLQLRVEVDKARRENHDLAGEKSRLESAFLETQERQAEWEAEQSQFEQSRREFEAEKTQQLEELGRRDAEFERRIEELDVRSEEVAQAVSPDVYKQLQTRCDELAGQLGVAERARAEAENTLGELRANPPSPEADPAAAAQLEELAQKQRQLEADQQQLQNQRKELEDSAEELYSSRAGLDQERAEWQDARKEIEQKLEAKIVELNEALTDGDGEEENYDDVDEVEFTTPDDSSPADTSSLFGDLKDGTGKEMPAPSDRRGRPRIAVTDDRRDEADISDYMRKLLTRVDGHSMEEGQVPAETARVVIDQPAQDPVECPEPEAEKKDAQDLKPKEFMPRIRPPELDLSLMRDLANETARSAINRHSSKVWLQAAVSRWCISAVASATGVALLYYAKHFASFAGFCGMASLAVSFVWLFQGVWLTRIAMQSHSIRRKPSLIKPRRVKEVPEVEPVPDGNDQPVNETPTPDA